MSDIQKTRDFVYQNFVDLNVSTMAKELNVSKPRIYELMEEMNLTGFDQDDIDYVKRKKGVITKVEMARNLEKTRATIYRILRYIANDNEPTKHFGAWQRQDFPHVSTQPFPDRARLPNNSKNFGL